MTQQTISFEVRGDPKAQKRPRFAKRGRFVAAIDDSQVDKADFLALAHQHAPAQPVAGTVSMTLEFYFRRPRSHYRANGMLKESAACIHSSRPDIDNLIKFVLDALAGVFFIDDAQVCDLYAIKRYDSVPRICVRISSREEPI